MNTGKKQYLSFFSRKLSKPISKLTITLAALISSTLPAEAINFNFSYDPGTSLEQMLGFEMAGQIWSSYLTDNITVDIHVGVTDLLPTNVIGGALPGLTAYQNYGNFRNSMSADRTSSDDYTAYSNLHNYQYSDGYTRYRAYFEDNVWYNKNIALTNANAKALGITPSNDLDGLILMSDLSQYTVDWNYDYSRQNSMASDELDFLSVAMHEIGHVLGFVSGVDSTVLAEAQASYDQNIERLMHTTSLDMYRYTAWIANDSGYLDLAYGIDSYFSIDGGDTALAHFSEGKDLLMGFGGDGFQASHWQQESNPIGIMDPDLALGERENISDMDLRAFDVIGYNCAYYNYSGSYSSCDAASLNLSSLEYQAKDVLIGKINDDKGYNYGASQIDWYINNGYNYTAASWIDKNRNGDLNQMIRDSDLYEQWGYGNGNGNGNGGSYPVEIAQLLATEGMFNEASGFNWSTMASLEAQEVPEPGSKAGLMVLGLLASGSLVKRYRKWN